MDKLKLLLSCPSVSGSESEYKGILENLFGNTCEEIRSDKIGNFFALKNSERNTKKVLIDAHFDVIGLMVSAIEEDGLISFVTVGGVDTRILPAMKTVIHGKRAVKGVIGVPPPHLQKGDTDSPYTAESLKIDTGLTAKELSEIVSVGDLISFDSEVTELLNGEIASAGLDNKAGVYAAYLISELAKLKNTQLTFAITSGEEIGLKGAKAAANTDEFDLCIIIDVTHGKTPDAGEHITFPCGSGAVLTPGPVVSKKYTRMLMKYAEEKNISYGIEVVSESTGTNSAAYEVAGAGNPCVVISVPLKYMHTAYEVVNFSDITAVAELTAGFISECIDGED